MNKPSLMVVSKKNFLVSLCFLALFFGSSIVPLGNSAAFSSRQNQNSASSSSSTFYPVTVVAIQRIYKNAPKTTVEGNPNSGSSFTNDSSVSSNPQNKPAPFPVTYGKVIPASQTQLFVTTTSGTVVFSGNSPSNGVLKLHPGEYSFDVQSNGYGVNATLATVTGPTTVRVLVGPYVDGGLYDPTTKTWLTNPTNSSLVAQAVFGSAQSSSGAGNIPCCCYNLWRLYKSYNMGSQFQTQGAVYSWGPSSSDNVQNQPSPTQYEQTDSYNSINGGGMTSSGYTTHSLDTSYNLPYACQYGCPSKTWSNNYDVLSQGTWTDYIYRQYNSCNNQWTGGVEDKPTETQWSTWGVPSWDTHAYSTSDYQFSYVESLGLYGQSSNTFSVTEGTITTQSTGFSDELSLCLSASTSGGDFSGCFDVAGYTSLDSGTNSQSVMYSILATDYCGSFNMYKAGWVLGWNQGPSTC